MSDISQDNPRIYRQNWLSQFGLYSRYQRSESRKNKSGYGVGFYGIIGMICILIFVIFLILHDFSETTPLINIKINENINETNGKILITTEMIPEQIDHNYKTIELSTTPLNYHSVESVSDESVMDINLANHRLDDYDDDSEEMENSTNLYESLSKAEKLIYPPSQDLKPPNLPYRLRNKLRRQFEEVYPVYVQPQPFNYQMKGIPPHAFQKYNTTSVVFPQIPKDYSGPVNNIQEIIHHINEDSYPAASTPLSNQNNKIMLTGTYKHPKEYTDITRMFESMAKKPSTTHTLQYPYGNNNNNPTKGDPFYNYKPHSPSDINSLAVNNFRFSPNMRNTLPPPFQKPLFYPNHSPQYNQDLENIYQQFIASSYHRQQENDRNGATNPKHKPFSLMLDIYPMHDDDSRKSVSSTKRPYKQNYRNQLHLNSGLLNNYQLGAAGGGSTDNSYFNNMNFPQIQQPRYPSGTNNYLPNLFYRNRYNDLDTYKDPYRDDGYSDNENDNSNTKPGQMVVHLNLYPKNKNRPTKHRSVQILGHETDSNKRASHEHNVYMDDDIMISQGRSMNTSPEIMSYDKKYDGINFNNESPNVGIILPSALTSPPANATEMIDDQSSPFSKQHIFPTQLINNYTTTVEIIRSVEINPNIDFENITTSTMNFNENSNKSFAATTAMDSYENYDEDYPYIVGSSIRNPRNNKVFNHHIIVDDETQYDENASGEYDYQTSNDTTNPSNKSITTQLSNHNNGANSSDKSNESFINIYSDEDYNEYINNKTIKQNDSEKSVTLNNSRNFQTDDSELVMFEHKDAIKNIPVSDGIILNTNEELGLA